VSKRKILNSLGNKRSGKIFVLSGPSGSGKTTLHNVLLKDRRIKARLIKIVSATTRQRRVGEKQGKQYWFFTKKQFLDRKKQGFFLESQKVFADYYGTPKDQVVKALRQGKNVLLCIDVKGARVIFKGFKNVVGIFINAPSVATLKVRLQARGTEDAKTQKERLAVAQQEMKEAKYYQYRVVNDRVQKAVGILKKIMHKEFKSK
jgi:guanylate kinase